MKLTIYQADAFTSKVFGGNPAAVCPLDHWIPDELMQSIALENNLSETAFFVEKEDGITIRWFTPATEIDLCGHATLATAHIIYSELGFIKENIVFQSKSGTLTVTKTRDGYELDFPSRPAAPVEDENQLTVALGGKPAELLKARDYLAVFNSEDEVLALDPDFSILNSLDVHAVIATAPANEADFVSRFFAPSVGINEDPVTGSAHCTLIPYWSERLGKKELHAFQRSAHGGELFCADRGERVGIAGSAVTYLKGEIEV